jgi:FlaG/FlaF family flagellin (archaellin)
LAVRFKDLSLPQGVKTRLTLAPQGVVGLAYDNNGDGSFDIPVNPTVVLTGTQASDVTGPVLAINYVQQGNLVNISIGGQDNISGISNIKFSTDGVNFNNYQSPFTLTYQGTPVKIYAFADDTAGNRSGLFVKEINLQDWVAPTTVANQNPDPNQVGWNNTDVNVNLTSTDNTSGVGVKEIIFSTNGAQPIPNTIVPGNLANIQIQADGITNLSFGARDNVGNTEAFKSVSVRIDKTAPITQGS